jgi:hypothetical protein
VGTTEKPQLPPQRQAGKTAIPASAPQQQAGRPAAPVPASAPVSRPAARDQGAGENRAEIGAGLKSGIKAVARDALFERRPYLKMAFNNPYNLSLVGGGLAAAVLTGNPLLALGTLGLEVLWLLHAPDNERLRHILWDPRFERLKRALDARDRARRMADLSNEARGRVETLIQRQDEIHRLAAENPSFAGDLLQGELVKTDRLVDAFLEMALTCARYENYLGAIDAGALERERRRYEQAVSDAGDDTAQSGIAKRNLAIVAKRLDRLKEIRRYLTVARGQLDLIENSFQLIADQIVTMQSPQELSGQLDELLDGVEAVRETSRETEQLLAGIDRTM